MRISDWSSDVCSSDLLWELRKDVQAFIDVTRSQDVPDFSDLVQSGFSSTRFVPLDAQKAWTLETGTRGKYERFGWDVTAYHSRIDGEMLQFTTNSSIPASTFNAGHKIGRASCRERVCQYV